MTLGVTTLLTRSQFSCVCNGSAVCDMFFETQFYTAQADLEFAVELRITFQLLILQPPSPECRN